MMDDDVTLGNASITPWQRTKASLQATCVRAYFYGLDRLNEASTLRGVVAGVAGLCSWIKPDHIDAIVSVTLVVLGFIGAVTPDSIKREHWRQIREEREEEARETGSDPAAAPTQGQGGQ